MTDFGSSAARTAVTDDNKSKDKAAWRRLWKFPKSWREVKSLGWKFVLAFILFYLVRDTILYIIIPYLLYKGVINP